MVVFWVSRGSLKGVSMASARFLEGKNFFEIKIFGPDFILYQENLKISGKSQESA